MASALHNVPEDVGHEYKPSVVQIVRARRDESEQAHRQRMEDLRTNPATLRMDDSHSARREDPPPARRERGEARARPLSMPPTALASYAPPAEARDGNRDRDRGAERERDRERGSTRTSTSAAPTPNGTQRSSRSNRILGDYTLSKTLGAGSMGKVKLATHNITGEQVLYFIPSMLNSN